MAFNIIAETSNKLDYQAIYKVVFIEGLPFELIPMPRLGASGGDAVGISIPIANANKMTWTKLKPVLTQLNGRFECDIYELCGGQKFELSNVDTFKKSLLL
jgi:hypothetical protein